jgi:DNA-binding IclR family transcriptional regulator
VSKSALRVLEIMEFVADRREGCSHTAIAQGLDIPKSSLTALLQDLHSTGYLQRNPDTGVFTIGVQVLWLANSYLRNLNLVRLGQPVVAQLFARVREFALLAIPTGTEYVTICTESLPSVFAHTLQVGQRGPLVTSAVGRAMLAYMAPGEVDRILAAPHDAAGAPLSKQAIADLRKQLEVARKRGIGYSYEESIPGVVGIAAPVFNAAGTPVAAFGVGIPSPQMKGRDAAPIEEALREAAATLSAQLGYAAPDASRASRYA